MESPLGRAERAGLRARTGAALIDGLLVHASCRGIEAAGAAAYAYVPFEATWLLLAVTYSAACLAARGATLGKAACGLRVCTVAGGRVGLLRAALRETLGKLLSALPLCAGFLAVAGPQRRGWHDRVAATLVVRTRRDRGTRLAVFAGLGAGLLVVGTWASATLRLVSEVVPMLSNASLGRPAREDVPPLEVSRLEPQDEALCAAWLAEHGRAPADFLGEACGRYPLVIVGEQHWQHESLAFLRDVLPDLHRRGVRCLAMEWLLAEDDQTLERLVTQEVYDPELALELARHQPWHTWGWKGYLDVLEAAWRLNAGLAPEARLAVVGIDLPIDLPSLALSGVGDEAVAAPPWERLRAWRLIRELPRAILRDAYMARQVERHAFERGERTLVWVGAAHSALRCRGPGDATGPGRMGFLLARRHPGAIAQAYLHDAFGRGPQGSARESGISDLVERLMERRGNAPLAWDVTGSPFAALRDSRHWSFGRGGGKSLGDLACSYVFLAPRSALRRSDWAFGYVTDRLWARYRPLYEAIGRRTGSAVRDARSADLALSRQ